MQLFVITFTGADRPGIVDRLAAVVEAHGGNWEESRMATLAGRFAGILLVAVPPDRGEALVAALRAVDGLNLIIEEGEFDPVETEDLWTLTLTGSDQPGIVQQVTRAVAKAGGNIVAFDTETEEAPMEGGVLFRCTASLAIHPDAVETLAGSLEAVLRQLVEELQVLLHRHRVLADEEVAQHRFGLR